MELPINRGKATQNTIQMMKEKNIFRKTIKFKEKFILKFIFAKILFTVHLYKHFYIFQIFSKQNLKENILDLFIIMKLSIFE